MRATALLLAVFALSLVACGDDSERIARTAGGEPAGDALPAPQPGGGPVTGMPDAPGPGDIPITGAPPDPSPDSLPDEAFELPPLEDNPETGLLADDRGALPITGVDNGMREAVAVLRDYYAALNAGHYNRAYALWSDGGRSSGQSPQQFAATFVDTAGLTVQIGEPGEVRGGIGASLVEVPVAVTHTLHDGGRRQYRGGYVLRRGAAGGTNAGPQAWRIADGDLREVQP